MTMDFIDLRTQYQRYQDEIALRMKAVFQHGQFVMGPEIPELEKTLADYVGARHCITVASGTDSLEIALRAARIGPGDEVLTVPFTWISTAEAVPWWARRWCSWTSSRKPTTWTLIMLRRP